MNSIKLYTAKEASQIIGVKPSTISQWDKKGIIKYQLNDKNKKLYDISSIPDKYKSTKVSSTNNNPTNNNPTNNNPTNNNPTNPISITNKNSSKLNTSKLNNSKFDIEDSDNDDENSYEEFTKSLDPETAEKVKRDKEKFELLLSIIDKIVVNHFSNDSTKNVDVSDIVRRHSDRETLIKLDKLSDLFISKERENESDFHRYLYKNILPKLSESENENIINYIRNKKLYKAYINYTDRFMRLVIKEIKLSMAKDNQNNNESNNNNNENNNNDSNDNETNDELNKNEESKNN